MPVVARPAGRRREPPGPPRGLRPARLDAAGDDGAALQVAEPAARRAEVASREDGPGRVEPLRGGRVHPLERRRRLSERDVPLPADRGPLRRHRAAGGHGYQVHVGPMYSDARGSVQITSADPRVKPALRFNYLSTAQDRREWVEACAPHGRSSTQPAFEPFDGGELSPGRRSRRTTDPRLGGARRRDGAASVVHVRDGHRDVGRRSRDDARPRARRGCASSTRSVVPATSPNGNIYAPMMMVAERAADLIRGNTPLPAGRRPVLQT